MGFIPTPQQAALARNNAGFFNRLGSTFLHTAPYLGPAYNVGSSIAHVIQGTQGQYGPATTPLGWIWSHLTGNFAGNPTNAPRATAVNPVTQVAGQPPGTVRPPGAPLAFNQYPTAFGSFPMLPGEISGGAPISGYDPATRQPIYNPRGYIPAGAPSAALGPPHEFDRTAPISAVPSFASALMQYVRSKNQA